MLTCNFTMIVAVGTYISWVDLYAMACMLSVIGVYALFRIKNKCAKYVVAVISFAISLGIYQAYISVALGLFAFLYLLQLIDGVKLKDYFKQVFSHIVTALISAALYYGVWRFLLLISKISPSETGNSLTLMFGEKNLFDLLIGTYRCFIKFYIKPACFYSSTMFDSAKLIRAVLVLSGVCMLAISFWSIIKKARKTISR